MEMCHPKLGAVSCGRIRAVNSDAEKIGRCSGFYLVCVIQPSKLLDLLVVSVSGLPPGVIVFPGFGCMSSKL